MKIVQFKANFIDLWATNALEQTQETWPHSVCKNNQQAEARKESKKNYQNDQMPS